MVERAGAKRMMVCSGEPSNPLIRPVILVLRRFGVAADVIVLNPEAKRTAGGTAEYVERSVGLHEGDTRFLGIILVEDEGIHGGAFQALADFIVYNPHVPLFVVRTSSNPCVWKLDSVRPTPPSRRDLTRAVMESSMTLDLVHEREWPIVQAGPTARLVSAGGFGSAVLDLSSLSRRSFSTFLLNSVLCERAASRKLGAFLYGAISRTMLDSPQRLVVARVSVWARVLAHMDASSPFGRWAISPVPFLQFSGPRPSILQASGFWRTNYRPSPWIAAAHATLDDYLEFLARGDCGAAEPHWLGLGVKAVPWIVLGALAYGWVSGYVWTAAIPSGLADAAPVDATAIWVGLIYVWAFSGYPMVRPQHLLEVGFGLIGVVLWVLQFWLAIAVAFAVALWWEIDLPAYMLQGLAYMLDVAACMATCDVSLVGASLGLILAWRLINTAWWLKVVEGYYPLLGGAITVVAGLCAVAPCGLLISRVLALI
jgi:hypothetical protein